MGDGYDSVLIRNELAGVLNEAQRNSLGHKMGITSLLQLYENNDSETFESELIDMINRILITTTKGPHIERIIKFLCQLLARIHLHVAKQQEDDQTEDFLSTQTSRRNHKINITSNILEYLLETSQAANKTVRYRSCQFIGITLNHITTEIDDRIWEELKQNLLIRTQDKIPQIRVAAIVALRRLHDSTDRKDRVVLEFIRILSNDVQKEVRKAVIQSLGIERETIPIFIERTKDVAPEVRKEVYRVLGTTKQTTFTTEQLITIFENGLADRDAKVVKHCQKIITKFSSKMDLLAFISSLLPQQNQKLIEKIICFLVSDRKFDFSAIERTEEHAVEYNILHRIFLHKAQQDRNDEYDDYLPEIFDICKQIILMYQEEEMFDLKQLLQISGTLDYSNEAGRRKMSTILREILREVKQLDLHPPLVSLLRKLHPDESDFIQMLLEILADIVEPLEDEEDENEEEPHETFTRVLSICEEILRYTEMAVSHPGIGNGLLQNYILPSLRHADCVVREKALACLGLYCLLDVKEAAKYLLLFVKVVGSAEPDAVQLVAVQLVAVRTLFDFLTLFGPETLIKQEKEWPEEFQVWNEESDEENDGDDDDVNDTRSFTIVTLVRCLTQTKNAQIRSTAVEGFAKLLLNNFLSDFQIVSVLITLYFHPATDRDQQLTQCLGVFFPAYCLNSPKHTETLKEAFLPTLERILGSNQYSPLRKVNIEKVVQFMIMHIDMSNTKLPSKSLPGHDELAVGVTRLVLNNLNTNKEMSKSLCKVLSSMRITDKNSDISSRLSSSVVRLLDKISEKPLQKILNTIQNTLHKNGKKRRSKSPPRGRKSPARKRRRTKSPSPDPPKTRKRRRSSVALRTKTSPNKKAKTRLREDSEEENDNRDDVIELGNEEISDSDEEQQEQELPQEIVEPEPVKAKRIVISFSGFTMSENVYNYTYLHSLVRDAKKLGAELILGNVIDSSITHIVSPPNQRTMKTIVGSITNRWIVVPEWLTKSAKAGKFLREELYGGKTTGKPFKDKKIFISKQFIDENPNKQFNYEILKSLICNAGKGSLIKSEKGADFVLCSKSDPLVSSSDHNVMFLTWKGFFEFLQPTVNIL